MKTGVRDQGTGNREQGIVTPTTKTCRWDPGREQRQGGWWPRVLAEIRRIIYTTNAIESLNMSLRKAIKTRGAFPSEEAALKVMYLALKKLARRMRTVQGWNKALNRFALLWEARFPQQRG